jgi:hypothetical protein
VSRVRGSGAGWWILTITLAIGAALLGWWAAA